MTPTPSTDSTLIAILPLKFGGQDLLPCDVFDVAGDELATPARVAAMIKGRKVAPLSKSSMRIAVTRRGFRHGFPAGLDAQDLVDRGIMTEDEALALSGDGTWTPPANAVRVEKLWLVPSKGPIPVWTIMTDAGEKLNDGKSIRAKAAAVEKATELSAAIKDSEQGNGSDLQSSASG